MPPGVANVMMQTPNAVTVTETPVLFFPFFFDSFLSHYFWGGNGVGCKEAAIMAIIIRNYLLVANRVVPFFPAGEACLKNPFA